MHDVLGQAREGITRLPARWADHVGELAIRFLCNMKRRGNLRGGGTDPGNREIAPDRCPGESAAAPDPHLVALVKYLARGAAERDYAERRKPRPSADPVSGTTRDSP